MTNILYYSVHEVLEYDDLCLFKQMGHNVFSIGSYRPDIVPPKNRGEILFNKLERDFHKQYEVSGGKYHEAPLDRRVIPQGFIDRFDISIVIHELFFIALNWSELSQKVVVRRTIGQGVDLFEDQQRPYTDSGMKLVHYSNTESRVPYAVKNDAIIRFAKDPNVYAEWLGVRKIVLTFTGSFQARYPSEYIDYILIANKSSYQFYLGGPSNQTTPQTIGNVSDAEQRMLLKQCAVYLYLSGPQVPYTLNFIEAWMTGIPVVVYSPPSRRGPYFEICDLIEDGVSGFVCNTIDDTVKALESVIEDRALADRISRNARIAAIRLFGDDTIKAEWSNFFACAIG